MKVFTFGGSSLKFCAHSEDLDVVLFFLPVADYSLNGSAARKVFSFLQLI